MHILWNDSEAVTEGLPGSPSGPSRGAGSSAVAAGSRARDAGGTASPAFLMAEDLLRLWSSHVRKIMEVRTSRKKLERARAYLRSPGCHESLARAYLEIRSRAHARQLDELRRLRRRVWELAGSRDALPAGSHARRPWSEG